MHWQINFLPLIDFKKIFLRLTKIKDYHNPRIVFFSYTTLITFSKKFSHSQIIFSAF